MKRKRKQNVASASSVSSNSGSSSDLHLQVKRIDGTEKDKRMSELRERSKTALVNNSAKKVFRSQSPSPRSEHTLFVDNYHHKNNDREL